MEKFRRHFGRTRYFTRLFGEQQFDGQIADFGPPPTHSYRPYNRPIRPDRWIRSVRVVGHRNAAIPTAVKTYRLHLSVT